MELSEQLREAVLNWVGCYKGYKTEEQENEDMLKFIGEKIEGKEDVYITSWSWGNYDALKVVKMALKRGKKVHWKILDVANEYYLGWEYYNGKESFLTELGNFLSDATKNKDKLCIKVREQTKDAPSTSFCLTGFIQGVCDAISKHPNRDMAKLGEIVDKNLLDKNSNSAKYNSVGGHRSSDTFAKKKTPGKNLSPARGDDDEKSITI